jgi:tetratricopeptide (TPR) repeat protein
VREAQAIARLAHPNVVAVFDAGTWDGQVFLAMERVDGGTLADWLEERQRSWREIRDAFVQAGRGLAAAHAAGLVHRDFKPSNVLVGRDGRVRVGDFGLARPTAEDAGDAGAASDDPIDASLTETLPSAGDSAARGKSGRALDISVTEPGTLLGTPAYMAPEQHQRRAADARTDQFGFCVALYEALYGQSPFQPANDDLPRLMAIAAEVLAGRVRDPPPSSRVPGWLHRIVLRGLSVVPADRYPSMDALLASLTRDRTAIYRNVAIAAGLTGLALAYGLTRGDGEATKGPRCELAGQAVEEIWNSPRKASVEAAFRATGAAWADRAWTTVEAGLNAHARDWASRRVAACTATMIRGEQSPAMMDLRMGCLDERMNEMRALVDVLAGADEQVVLKASTAVAALPPLSYCDDTAALVAKIPPPIDPAVRARVDELRAMVATARALRDAGRYEDARTRAAGAVEQLAVLGYQPLLAEALSVLGDIEEYLGDYPRSLATQQRAINAALAGRHDEYLARAAADQAWVLGVDLGRHDDATRWIETAEATLTRLAHRGELAGQVEGYRGSLAATAGHPLDAERHHRRSLELREAFFGPDHPRVAASLSNLGRALRDLGRNDEAIEALRRSLEIKEKTQGAEHPDVAYSLQNLAAALHGLGRFDEALELLERRRRVAEAVYAADHPAIATAIDDLGVVLADMGRTAEALAHHEQALAARKVNDPGQIPISLWNIGSVHANTGHHAEALGYLTEALSRREALLGGDTPILAKWHDDLAEVYEKVGRNRAARHHRARAVTLRGSE